MKCTAAEYEFFERVESPVRATVCTTLCAPSAPRSHEVMFSKQSHFYAEDFQVYTPLRREQSFFADNSFCDHCVKRIVTVLDC